MILSYLHQGSGAGNQLFRMVAARVRAKDLGVDWGMVWNPDNSGKPIGFKCKDFIDFDESKITHELPEGVKEWHEKKFVESGIDIRSFDPEFNFVEDNTIIEGEFQSPQYFEHRRGEVNDWLKVEPIEIQDDTCVIGFRGGEFALYPDLFLTKDYWQQAISAMKDKGIKHFEIHTDDKELAENYFIDLLDSYSVQHNIGINWRSVRSAKYAIIANSSFFILPRLLRHYDGAYDPLKESKTIAPHYWGRRNTKTWSLPQNFYKDFLYI